MRSPTELSSFAAGSAVFGSAAWGCDDRPTTRAGREDFRRKQLEEQPLAVDEPLF